MKLLTPSITGFVTRNSPILGHHVLNYSFRCPKASASFHHISTLRDVEYFFFSLPLHFCGPLSSSLFFFFLLTFSLTPTYSFPDHHPLQFYFYFILFLSFFSLFSNLILFGVGAVSVWGVTYRAVLKIAYTGTKSERFKTFLFFFPLFFNGWLSCWRRWRLTHEKCVYAVRRHHLNVYFLGRLFRVTYSFISLLSTLAREPFSNIYESPRLVFRSIFE